MCEGPNFVVRSWWAGGGESILDPGVTSLDGAAARVSFVASKASAVVPLILAMWVARGDG